MRVCGKNVFKEIDPKDIRKVYLSNRFNDKEIVKYIQDNKISYIPSDDRQMDRMMQHHQGIIVEINDYEYKDLNVITKDDDFVVILDHLEDPHNFGAIIRTCETRGIKNIIIPKDRSVVVNDTVMKTSTGALNHVNIIMVSNLVNAINKYEITVEEILNLLKNLDLIKNGYIDYNNGINQLEVGKKELSDGYEIYLSHLEEYKKAEQLLKNKEKEYNEGVLLYQTNLEEYNVKKFDFEQNIKDAREKVGKIERARWYIYDRRDNNDYLLYINSAQSIKNLAGLFPVVFFGVAVFISLLSMSRMAFEDRGEIGTLKSLGFSNMQIRYKYIIYSLMATLLGGIFGSIFGHYFISWMIFDIYKMLFEVPIFIYELNITPMIVGIIISTLCICGATILTINGLIKEKTTDLLRPKAPALGKKIILERIKFIWNRFSFSNKIMVRNIFRYKKRISMIIIGIVGCTVLLLSGYAIKDSIINIIDIQYKDVLKYDDAIYISDNFIRFILIIFFRFFIF